MIFRYPAAFLLIPLCFLILWLRHTGRGPGKRILYPFSQRKINFGVTRGFLLTYVPLLLKSVALSFLVFAVARPQTSSTNTKRSSEGIDIMIAFDVSKSMLIEDYQPYSRLDVAKDTVKKFIAGRKDDRIGFLMFSGESITLCPPTLDYEVLEQAVDQANTNSLKDGTAIGDALANAVNRIKDSPAKSKVIILITDGDNNMGSITPLTAGGIAQGYGIKVYSIALGKEGLVPLPVYDNSFGIMRKRYEQIESSIKPDLLMKISEETGGKFFRPRETSSLKEVFKEIDKLERNRVETRERVQWEEHFQKFLLLGLIFLAVDFILGRSILRVLPN